jgi:hypothetical protein
MEEGLLVGGRDSFMTVRHLVLRGRNRQIGAWLAEVAATRHGLTGSLLRESDPGQACSQAAYVMQQAPILWERAQGVAQGLDLDLETCDSTSLPYNQLPPGLAGLGCSLVYYPPSTAASGSATLSRNFDFPKFTAAEMVGLDFPDEVRHALRPLMADPYLLEVHPTDGGIPSLAMVCFDLLTGVLDGLNAEGLLVAVNGDEIALGEGTKTTTGGIGLNELACMRVVLDSCATASEARRLLERVRHYVSMVPCHYLVADRAGEGFVFEIDAEGRPHVSEAGDDPLILTNHPLHRFPDRSSFPVPYDFLTTGTTTFDRFVRLEEELAKEPGLHDVETMERVCDSVSLTHVLESIPESVRRDVAASPGFSRTLWHALYDAEERSLRLRFYVGEESRPDGTFVEQYAEPIAVRLGR